MQIAIINDNHFGEHSGAKYYLDYQERFFKEIFIPFLIKHNITTVFIAGDIFHKRKTIDFYVLYRAKQMLFDILRDYNIQIYMFPGNHDCALKETNKINSLNLLLKDYSNVTLIEQPEIRGFDVNPVSFMFIPWINEENYEDTMKYMHF